VVFVAKVLVHYPIDVDLILILHSVCMDVLLLRLRLQCDVPVCAGYRLVHRFMDAEFVVIPTVQAKAVPNLLQFCLQQYDERLRGTVPNPGKMRPWLGVSDLIVYEHGDL